MRSMMTVPVIVQRFVDKAPAAGADAICLDLEDSIPPAEKAAARPLARQAIEAMPRSGFALYVRVNGYATGLTEADLAAVVRPGHDGIVLSKAESREMIADLDAHLGRLETEHGIEDGHGASVPLIETAKGMMEASEGCRASPRGRGANFGAAEIGREVALGRVVFVDVTADWCITCQVNKALVIDRGEVARRLGQSGVVAMRADWTRPDSRISAFLQR